MIDEQAITAGSRAVEEYLKSKDFKDEVAKGSFDAYHLRFTKCKKKVTEAFSGYNLDGIIDVEPEEKEKEEEEGKAEEVKKTTKGLLTSRSDKPALRKLLPR